MTDRKDGAPDRFKITDSLLWKIREALKDFSKTKRVAAGKTKNSSSRRGKGNALVAIKTKHGRISGNGSK